ncbi:MAG TPA: hypothetical protein VG245_00295 [Candidatus Dormibacteraeota bacterium]|nr:hypothetical protein [Candidatus Dormibacteraeota bacterium]
MTNRRWLAPLMGAAMILAAAVPTSALAGAPGPLGPCPTTALVCVSPEPPTTSPVDAPIDYCVAGQCDTLYPVAFSESVVVVEADTAVALALSAVATVTSEIQPGYPIVCAGATCVSGGVDTGSLTMGAVADYCVSVNESTSPCRRGGPYFHATDVGAQFGVPGRVFLMCRNPCPVIP